MNMLSNAPWQLSFSYGRALQESTLKTWSGNNSNAEKAQQEFYHRAKCTGAARNGQYNENMEIK